MSANLKTLSMRMSDKGSISELSLGLVSEFRCNRQCSHLTMNSLTNRTKCYLVQTQRHSPLKLNIVILPILAI